MVNKTIKNKTKRLSKGQRTHIRRLKQVARKEISSKFGYQLIAGRTPTQSDSL